MKLNKRKIFVIAIALCLTAILSFSTLAWFTANDSVTNEFLFADSDDDGNVDFSIDVWETVDPERDGTTAEVGKGVRDSDEPTVTYEEVLPGDELVKTAHITNTSSSERYSQYVRATIILKDPAGAWKKAFDEGRIGLNAQGRPSALDLLNEMFKTVDYSNTWTIVPGNDSCGYNDTDKCFYWTFYYNANNGILEKGQTVELFDKVFIPTGLLVEDANGMSSTFEIDVKAEAIQAESLNLSYPNANNAFKLVG